MQTLDLAKPTCNSGPIHMLINARPPYAYYSMVGFKIE